MSIMDFFLLQTIIEQYGLCCPFKPTSYQSFTNVIPGFPLNILNSTSYKLLTNLPLHKFQLGPPSLATTKVVVRPGGPKKKCGPTTPKCLQKLRSDWGAKS